LPAPRSVLPVSTTPATWQLHQNPVVKRQRDPSPSGLAVRSSAATTTKKNAPLSGRHVAAQSGVDQLRIIDLDKDSARSKARLHHRAPQQIHAQIELQRGDLKAARSFCRRCRRIMIRTARPLGLGSRWRFNDRDFDAAAKSLASWKQEELIGAPARLFQSVTGRHNRAATQTQAAEAFIRARVAIASQLAKQPDDRPAGHGRLSMRTCP